MPDAMDRKDTEMSEREDVTAAASHQQPNDGGERELLALARHFITQGNPSQALQAVVMAMRIKGGDDAVFQSLNRARELYIHRIQQNTAIDQLAALFAECAIAEAQPSLAESSLLGVAIPSVAVNVYGNSILAETGKTQIVLDAFSDGSSFICLQCGGLVGNHRKDEHHAYWCIKL